MKTCSKSAIRRGLTLIELLLATSIFSAILVIAVGAYVSSTRGMSREASQVYTQERVRSTLNEITTDCRSSRLVLPYAWKSWNWNADFYQSSATTTTMQNGKPTDACIILQVPSQDDNGTFARGTAKSNGGLFVMDTSQMLACIPTSPPGGAVMPTTAANFLATDTVIYYHQKSDNTLRRTIWPAKNVVTPEGQTRSSFRDAETARVLVRDVTSFTPTFRDVSGAACSPGARAAQLDFNVTVSKNGSQGTASSFAITGVRLRNMRNGSITGTMVPASGQKYDYYVEAISRMDKGMYPYGTVVGTAWTDTAGKFEVAGLADGTYILQFTQPQASGGTPAGPKAGTARVTAPYTVTGESQVNAGTINYSTLTPPA
jgi:prepilin-type N-terminal cleavage/methylation domain-containing protein